MVMEKSDINLDLTMHKVLYKTAGIGNASFSMSKFGQQKLNEQADVSYCFMAGPLSGSSTNPLNQEGKGVCIVYFPPTLSVFIKYFDSAGTALGDFWWIYYSNLKPSNLFDCLQERKYLLLKCNLVREILG